MESLQHFNLLLRFLVFVFAWFGLTSFSAPKSIRHSNQTHSSVRVVFSSPVCDWGIQAWGCQNSNQTKHECLWTGKKRVIYFFLIWPSVWIRRYFRCVVFLFVWHSEHAEWDRVGEHRQPHWSWWQVAVLWPSVVSSSLSFFKSLYKQWNILYLKSLNVLFPQSKNN